MDNLSGIARLLMLCGLLLLVGGGLLYLLGRSFPLGRLPGDILLRRGNFTFYFPLITCLLLSLLLTLLLNLFWRR